MSIFTRQKHIAIFIVQESNENSIPTNYILDHTTSDENHKVENIP